MFTVIIPLYNKAPYLQRALDSVYAQSVPVDEVIIVDDGSTDGGEALARAQSDPRVRVLGQPNRGVSAARNAGIRAATQPFLAFLDADDVWLPGFIGQVREMIEAEPGAVLYGTGFETVRDGRRVRRHGVRAKDLRDGDARRAGGGSGRTAPCFWTRRPAFGPVDFFKAWSRGHVINASSMAVPREAALGVGGFPEGVSICEDHEFWAKLALAGPVVLSAEALTRYDVGVPGQAVEYWEGAYKRDFEVLAFHRFLARELKQHLGNTEARGPRSFKTYARRELMRALAQRVYWGDFRAAAEFYHGLGLARMRMGCVARLCGWIAEHPAAQPVVNAGISVVRAVRGVF